MKLRLVLALALTLVAGGCSVAPPANGPITSAKATGSSIGSSVRSLPLSTATTHCVGEPGDRVAVLAVPNGKALWDIFPEAGEFPELQALDAAIVAVVYVDGWPGEILSRVGSEPREPKPGTWDVCLEVADPHDDILGQPYIVLGGIPTDSAVLSGQ